MATNPFSSPLSSSVGLEREELDEFTSTSQAGDFSYHLLQPNVSQESVISLQHHNQALTSNSSRATSFTPSFPHIQSHIQEEEKGNLADLDVIKHRPSYGASRLGRWCPPLRPLGRLLRRLNPRLQPVDGLSKVSSLEGSWYLSPEQHILEFVLVNLMFGGLFVYFVMNLVEHGGSTTPAAPTGTVIMYVLAGLLALSFAYAIYYKWATKSLIFLLQPCHVVTTVELLVLFCPRGSVLDMTQLFNLMLYWIWNPLIAISQPDLRDYKHWWDVFNFFFQHALIIFIPFYLLFSRHYDFYAWSWNSLMVAFILQVHYHFFVLEVVNIFMDTNLNYMMSPPPGPLVWFGSWYRVVMTILSFGLMIGQRLLLVDGLWWLAGDLLYDHVFHYFP